jgi:8-oxo-dGTP pyrophosphatase MutT (NUDIX family)
MGAFPTTEMLERALPGRPHPPVEGVGRPAAVLLCLSDAAVLLLRRAEHAADPWSGHISLPGGRFDEGDDGLLGTALRETVEEVGFDPLDHGVVLGPLGEYAGRGRGVRSVRIAAFVARLDERPPLVLSPEIASAHWVPLDTLEAEEEVVETPRGRFPAYRVPANEHDLVVWGITFGILELLREAHEPSVRRERP